MQGWRTDQFLRNMESNISELPKINCQPYFKPLKLVAKLKIGYGGVEFR